MNRDTSIYLDCARFLAALLVMLSHIDAYMVTGLMPFLDHLGLESVGVFFVLSGFVIGYATEFREKDLRTYAINRAARLYSVVVPCLVLTLLLDTAGKHFMPWIWYRHEGFLQEASHILFSFTFLNAFWILPHGVAPGSDGPFWSLCFEVPYYIVFGTAFFLRGLWRWLLPGLTIVLAGPRILAGFPLWLLGLGIYFLCRRVELNAAFGRGLMVLALLLWIAFELWLKYFNIASDAAANIKAAPILLYGSGICFALSVIGFRFSSFTLGRIAAPARWLAGATFTLYLLHLPLAWFLNGVMMALPVAAWPAIARWALLAGTTFALVLLTAEITERRKHVWRRGIERIFAVSERIFRIGARRPSLKRPAPES